MNLGDAYVSKTFIELPKGSRVPERSRSRLLLVRQGCSSGIADRAMLTRAGLVATNSIRDGENRKPLLSRHRWAFD